MNKLLLLAGIALIYIGVVIIYDVLDAGLYNLSPIFGLAAVGGLLFTLLGIWFIFGELKKFL